LNITFQSDGTATALWSEEIDLRELGTVTVNRASNVEFDANTQEWVVFDLAGKELHREASRNACLIWEQDNL